MYRGEEKKERETYERNEKIAGRKKVGYGYQGESSDKIPSVTVARRESQAMSYLEGKTSSRVD